MRRELTAAALAFATAAATATASAAPCTLVFAQARNAASAEAPDWDRLNEQFNTAVAGALGTDGRRVVAMALGSEQIDPRISGQALLRRADEAGCNTLVETTVFTLDDEGLVLRLRVHPLLLQLDGARIVGLRIGAQLFITQRELTLAALPRLKLDLLAQQMAAEYLQHDRR